MLDVLRGDLEETDGRRAIKKKGLAQKRSGSYVGVCEKPEVLLTTKGICQVVRASTVIVFSSTSGQANRKEKVAK